MDKIELSIIKIATTPSGNNAIALTLKEVDGNRRIEIVIGAYEAQAIALELEGITPPRPMPHDLLKNVIDKFGATVSEIFINDLNDGIYYSLIIIDAMGIEIDSRPSDAIALAVRFGCPIYIREDILEEAMSQFNTNDDFGNIESHSKAPKANPSSSNPISQVDKLNKQLDKALEDEDYEKAALIRDQIKKILDIS
jgi:hypothetical protein